MSAIKGPLLSVEKNSFVSWLCARLHSVAALILHFKPRANLSPAAVHGFMQVVPILLHPKEVFYFRKCCLNRVKEPINSCQCFQEMKFGVCAGRFIRRLQRLAVRNTCLETCLCASVMMDPGIFLRAVSGEPFCRRLCPGQLGCYGI